MALSNLANMLQGSHYDCLILVDPHSQVLDETIKQANDMGLTVAELSKELSKSLMDVSMNDRARFADKWVLEYLTSFQPGPIICAHTDLLFEPQLNVDPIALFRQAARITKIVILWLGDLSKDVLFYAAPSHKHYRTWRISDLLTHQPELVIKRIASMQGG